MVFVHLCVQACTRLAVQVHHTIASSLLDLTGQDDMGWGHEFTDHRALAQSTHIPCQVVEAAPVGAKSSSVRPTDAEELRLRSRLLVNPPSSPRRAQADFPAHQGRTGGQESARRLRSDGWTGDARRDQCAMTPPCGLSPSRSSGIRTHARAVNAAETRMSGVSRLPNAC